MIRKYLSYLLVFLMVFSIICPIDNISYAEEPESEPQPGDYAGQVINVRVEGKNEQHFNEKITVTNETTGLQLLTKAIGKNNIVMSDGLIISLYGEAGESEEGYSTSWGIYTKKGSTLESVSTEISKLDINGLDEIILHISACDSSDSPLTCIPVLETEQIDNYIILTVKKTVGEKVEGVKVIINGEEYKNDCITNKNGKVKIKLEAEEYKVQVSKEGDNYPELIRCTFDMTVEETKRGQYAGQTINLRVEGKDVQYLNQEITVIGETTGEDLLKKAIGEYIDGGNGTFGFFINSLYNESGEERDGYSTSWGLYTKNEGELTLASTGISGLDINELDEMLLHIKATDNSYNDITCIPVLEVDQSDNKTILTVKKKVTTYGPEPDFKPSTEEKIVEGAVVTIDNLEYSGCTNKNGQVEVELESGFYEVKVSKEGENYPELIRRQFNIAVGEALTIEELLDELRDHYSNNSTYTFREALAYNFSSDDINSDITFINQRYKIKDLSDENEKIQATDYAANIIGLLAAGENPRDYNGVDYVQTLIDAQDKESGRFAIDNEGGNPTQTAFSILALDMVGKLEGVGGIYNVESAVKDALLGFQDENTGSFGAVDDTAMCIMAIIQHRDVDGVNEAIEKAIAYIKTRQSDTGGFGYSEEYPEVNACSISAVIQGLMAAGENPLSEEWIKNDNSMLDALLSLKDPDLFEYPGVREQVFMAIADLYRGKSMYKNFKFVEVPDIPEPEYEFTLTNKGDTAIQKGSEAILNIEAKNNLSEKKKAILIIALYKLNGSNKEMVNYIFIDREIEACSKEELSGGFLIPETGNYEVKAMLWDNFDDKNPLAKEITIEVE